jgi:uncharacterized protein involved in outer membrane biogenesis
MSDMLRQTGGIVGGFIKLDTNGVSLREFLARMNGDAGVFVENGQVSDLLQRLAPIDVLGALGVYLVGDQPVPINCLVSRFEIKSGVATASTLLVDTKDTEIKGEGSINFGTEAMMISLTPRNKGFAPVSLRAPVDIGGTFAQPDFHIHKGEIIARLGAAIGLGIAFPPAALLALVDVGLGDDNACHAAYAEQKPAPKTGERALPKH